jgi:hypothetical protein
MGTMQTISLELDQIRCEELSRIQLADSTAALEEIRQGIWEEEPSLEPDARLGRPQRGRTPASGQGG